MTLLTMALPLWLHYFVYTHQGMTAAKRDLDDAQKQRDIDARKREKREFELERQKLREKLAQVSSVSSCAAPGFCAPSAPPRPPRHRTLRTAAPSHHRTALRLPYSGQAGAHD